MKENKIIVCKINKTSQLFGYGVRSLSDNNYNYTIFEKGRRFYENKGKSMRKEEDNI